MSVHVGYIHRFAFSGNNYFPCFLVWKKIRYSPSSADWYSQPPINLRLHPVVCKSVKCRSKKRAKLRWEIKWALQIDVKEVRKCSTLKALSYTKQLPLVTTFIYIEFIYIRVRLQVFDPLFGLSLVLSNKIIHISLLLCKTSPLCIHL